MSASAAVWLPRLIGICLIVALAAGLYLPFLGSPPVFDDRGFFSGVGFSYYAMHPFDFGLRVPSYFSLAVVQVFWGRIEAHRILSLALHAACSLALYKLLYELLSAAREPERLGAVAVQPGNTALACIGAGAFALHPVAVYAAAYLVQRSIVLATLFSLLSVMLFVRGLRRGSHADALSAAALYTIAVLCKEHSVLLPAAALLAIPLVQPERRFAVRHAIIYLAGCAPAAILVVLLSTGVIAASYEPEFSTIAAEIEMDTGRAITDFPWWLSVATQAGLFFKYLALWLWPDTGAMSIDLRIDFADTWLPPMVLLAVAGFLGYGLLGLYLLTRRVGAARVAGFGLLLPWILFLAEFTTIRIQEPFVLYRSYLWAPGLTVALAAALTCVSVRAATATALLVLPLLFHQAHERLRTFTSGLALWEDAVAKLPRGRVPGGSRTLYNLGREYLYADRPDSAIAVVDRCLAEYPVTYQCPFARAAIHLHLEQYREALPYLSRAIALRPESGVARHHLGVALENLGCLDEARAQYRLAAKLRFLGATHRLSRLDSPGSGLLPPVMPKPRTDACDKPLPEGAAPPRG
jgi:tetratricopeptide (TPR) repeat protein